MLQTRLNILGRERKWNMFEAMLAQLLVGLTLMAVEHLIWG